MATLPRPFQTHSQFQLGKRSIWFFNWWFCTRQEWFIGHQSMRTNRLTNEQMFACLAQAFRRCTFVVHHRSNDDPEFLELRRSWISHHLCSFSWEKKKKHLVGFGSSLRSRIIRKRLHARRAVSWTSLNALVSISSEFFIRRDEGERVFELAYISWRTAARKDGASSRRESCRARETWSRRELKLWCNVSVTEHNVTSTCATMSQHNGRSFETFRKKKKKGRFPAVAVGRTHYYHHHQQTSFSIRISLLPVT